MTDITRGDPPDLRNVRRNVYHHYIRVDNPRTLIFLSGQLARDADGNLVGKGDMAEQTRQCIRNMRTVLEAAGGTLDDIVSVVVYTTDIRQFKEIVAART
jgi:2-iminobutanoate/2-iminopropanoate deaminase